MNRREDPLLRQHCNRLLQLAETTNIKPGHGSGKRRGQRSSHGFSSSTNARTTLQDIVRNDPGYTSNIEHLVFPDRKGSNPNLASHSGSSSFKNKPKNVGESNNASTAKSKLVEVIAHPYMRGLSFEDAVTTKNKSFNGTSLNGRGDPTVITSSGHQPNLGSASSNFKHRRWVSQPSQSSKQHSTDGGGSHVGSVGGTGNTTSVQQPRRLSPASDPKELNSAISSIGTREKSERTGNVSIVHLRGTSSVESRESWENRQASNFSEIRSKSYNRASSIPGLKRQDASMTSGVSIGNTSSSRNRCQETQSQRRREATNSLLSGGRSTSGELFVSGNCSRELSPVRWCDHDVDGVYLGRSGWVQVQQRSLDENRKIKYESNSQAKCTGNSSAVTGTIPLPRRATVKLIDYHCSNSEPGKRSDYLRSHTLDSHRPDFLKLNSSEYEPPSGCASPHSIPESFSPPSITPIISPPPAFQDALQKRGTRSSRFSTTYGKTPFLPRSNAIVDSDLISPPPSPLLNKNWSSSIPSSTKKLSNISSKSRSRCQGPSQGSGNSIVVIQSKQDSKQSRLASAKSLEDQSSARRSQFAQRYLESSSSSSSSMGFRSLDSCVNRVTMPCLTENTDSSIEGYEDGDEDDNPDSLLNSAVSSPGTLLDFSFEGMIINHERLSPSGRQSRLGRSHQASRRSPGSSDGGKLSFDSGSSSSSSSNSTDRIERSPTPNSYKRSNQSRQQHQGYRGTLALSPDSLQASRVRRSKSLQLPEKRSPGSSNLQQQSSREHYHEANEPNKAHLKVINDKSMGRNKKHILTNRKTHSTEETVNVEVHRDPEIVTEYLYGTRSRPMTRNVQSGRYDNRDDKVDRRNTAGACDVYFISAKQPRQKQAIMNYTQQQQQKSSNKQLRTLQRGVTTPNTNSSVPSAESKTRCNTSTCNFWPHCTQRETLYSPNLNQTSMKSSQSYPSHRRMSNDNIINHTNRDRDSACSSPAALDIVEDRDMRKSRQRGEHYSSMSKSEERAPKSVLKQPRRSPAGSPNELDQTTRWEYRNTHGDTVGQRVSPIRSKTIKRSPNGGGNSSVTNSSSSSSDIWVTTSDRTVTKSPKNPKSSGGSTPIDDGISGSLKTLLDPQSDLSRPGSAPTKRGASPEEAKHLEPHHRSSSLPKSFLSHESTNTDG
ncbi:hypothetical protein KQX54_019935 [Cotesia glomerata]|uniref:Uncharacterized protein n=3 Tax=Braconidae TaxID=7402 RepID=A0AAV7J679_COTGL|nr:hypothetical protein KQX54_019935 [Cotesia glomerata]